MRVWVRIWARVCVSVRVGVWVFYVRRWNAGLELKDGCVKSGNFTKIFLIFTLGKTHLVLLVLFETRSILSYYTKKQNTIVVW